MQLSSMIEKIEIFREKIGNMFIHLHGAQVTNNRTIEQWN
jgi:hypothetical protein